MPLKGTTVIPAGWADHLRPVIRRTMTLPCQIVRPGDGPPPFGGGPVAEDVVWPPANTDGSCRLQQLERDATTDTASQPTTVRRYRASLPIDVLPLVVAGEGGDVLVAGGRRYEIQQVEYGSLLGECDLLVQDNQTQNTPGVIP